MGDDPVMSISVALLAGVLTVIVSTVGASQVMAAQLHVIGLIVKEKDYDLPELALQLANLVSIVNVFETVASMCDPYC